MSTKGSNYQNIRTYARGISKAKLSFTSEVLAPADNVYVGWLDLMGAGHMMGTSIQKTANFLVRLHMCVEIARSESGYSIKTLPINDGIFLVSKKKGELMTIVQHTMALLAARFIATPRPHDRCLMKGAIAYGPVYDGREMLRGITTKKLRENATFLDRVLFGPPIIQAYERERASPPYGIAVHESARAFSADGEPPFQMTHWLWWQDHKEAVRLKGVPPLGDLKDCLLMELEEHFNWMETGLLLHGLGHEKVLQWRMASRQYFSAG
jgi:hypothetical protein